jgi:MinD superfamily P-loop ATPase
LVTEPTPFGLHDLKQMLGVLDQIQAPAAVIVNRDGIGDEQVELFLSQTPYPILMRIPYDNEIAVGLAEGRVLTDFKPGYQQASIRIYEFILAGIDKDRVNQ